MRAICFIQETKDSDLTLRQAAIDLPPSSAQTALVLRA